MGGGAGRRGAREYEWVIGELTGIRDGAGPHPVRDKVANVPRIKIVPGKLSPALQGRVETLPPIRLIVSLPSHC